MITWQGILVGILIMMLSHYLLNVFAVRRSIRESDKITAIMIEGNELRAECNEVLSRIADGVNG